MTAIPQDLKYSSSHEWCKIDGDTVIIGITDFAQSQLGDIVFLELPEVGSNAEREKSFGTIESVKSVSDFIAPLSGTVSAVNESLPDNLERINTSPYEEAWMVKMNITDTAELDTLMNAEEYAAFCAAE